MSKFLAFSRVVVVVGVTVITFMCGVHFEKKVLAPRARAAAIAKFKANNAGRMKVRGLPIGPQKPCKPCVEEKKKADAISGDRKIIKMAQLLNPQPTPCSVIPIPPSGQMTGGIATLNVRPDENDVNQVTFSAGIECGTDGNFGCVATFYADLYVLSDTGPEEQPEWVYLDSAYYTWPTISCGAQPESDDGDGIPGVEAVVDVAELLAGVTYGITGGIFQGSCGANGMPTGEPVLVAGDSMGNTGLAWTIDPDTGSIEKVFTAPTIPEFSF